MWPKWYRPIKYTVYTKDSLYWNVSITLEWIAMTFCTNMRDPQGVTPNAFGKQYSPKWDSENVIYSVKYLYVYRIVWHPDWSRNRLFTRDMNPNIFSDQVRIVPYSVRYIYFYEKQVLYRKLCSPKDEFQCLWWVFLTIVIIGKQRDLTQTLSLVGFESIYYR